MAQILLFHSPAQTTAHSPELIFHIMKSRDQTSVVLNEVEIFMESLSTIFDTFKWYILLNCNGVKI